MYDHYAAISFGFLQPNSGLYVACGTIVDLFTGVTYSRPLEDYSLY